MRNKFTFIGIVLMGICFMVMGTIISLRFGFDLETVFYFGILMSTVWAVSYCVRDINAYTYDYKIGAGTVIFDILILGGAIAFNFTKLNPGDLALILIIEYMFIFIMILDTIISYIDIFRLRSEFIVEQHEKEIKSQKIEKLKQRREERLREQAKLRSQVATGEPGVIKNLIRIQSTIDNDKELSKEMAGIQIKDHDIPDNIIESNEY